MDGSNELIKLELCESIKRKYLLSSEYENSDSLYFIRHFTDLLNEMIGEDYGSARPCLIKDFKPMKDILFVLFPRANMKHLV